MTPFIELKKLHKGDSVAVIATSSDLSAKFPWVLDLGIKRLEQIFQLRVIEYPSARTMHVSHEQKAEEINNAFSNSDIKAIFSTIGGSEQIHTVPLLDKDIIKDNPKPFFGFSDNTNLSNLLWDLGIPSYYGGAVMTQLAMQNRMFDETIDSFYNALFKKGFVEIKPVSKYTDIDLDWSNPSNLTKDRPVFANNGWLWDGEGKAEGTLWGGCVETLSSIFFSSQSMTKLMNSNFPLIVFLETAEDIPDHSVIESVITSLGKRDILNKTKALLIGRPKTWQLEKQLNDRQKDEYKRIQAEVVLANVRKYNDSAIIIQNMDFGHTDPQILIPSGNLARIDSSKKCVMLSY